MKQRLAELPQSSASDIKEEIKELVYEDLLKNAKKIDVLLESEMMKPEKEEQSIFQDCWQATHKGQTRVEMSKLERTGSAARMLRSFSRISVSSQGNREKSESTKDTLPAPLGNDESSCLEYVQNGLTKVKRCFPIITWGADYTLETAKADILAGLTVLVLLIPQSMAYSMLAGLEPIYGMYSSVVPVLMYAIFGDSYCIAVGPVATTAIMVSSALDSIEPIGGWVSSEAKASAAAALCLSTGIILLILAVVQLGSIVEYLSSPVMSGFVTGAAAIIAINQFSHVLGLDPEKYSKGSNFFGTVKNVFSVIGTSNWMTVILSVVALAVLLSVKYDPLKTKLKSIPIPLLVVVLSILISAFGKLHDNFDVIVVGDIPKGLPTPSLPEMSEFGKTFIASIALAVTSYMTSIAQGKVFAVQSGTTISANQELLAYGMACIAGSFFSSHTVSASFSRSALANESNCKSQSHGIWTAVGMILVLLFMTPLFYHLPKAVFGAMILVSVKKLFKFDEGLVLYHENKLEFITWIVAFVGTLTFGIERGILFAVLSSLALVVFQSSRPSVALLAKMKNTDQYVPVCDYYSPDFFTENGVVVVQPRSFMFFGNINKIISKIKQQLGTENSTTGIFKKKVHSLIIDCSYVSQIDSTSCSKLGKLVRDLKQCNVGVYFSVMNRAVQNQVLKSKAGKDFLEFFTTTQSARNFAVQFHTQHRRVSTAITAFINNRKDPLL